jgi:hypothetical protein
MVKMPTGAKIISIQPQYGIPCIWAEVDTEIELTERSVYIIGTGHPMPPILDVCDFVGTYQITVTMDGSLVFHVYIVPEDYYE